jgi:ACT domain-containing protein
MKLSSILKSVVYPKGKVHKNYGRYVGWSCLSNVIISTESVLSTHSMLSVIGNASSELTLSVNYIGKDIVGQLGGLYYMNKMGQKADKEPIKFIKHSMVLQQSAVIMECVTPLLPLGAFIPIAGVANITKNISFTGFGAVNATIIQKLAEEDNIGEIYAKISVLNTIGSTFGMGLGLIIASKIPDHTMRLGLLPILAGIRIYTYNKAIDGIIE